VERVVFSESWREFFGGVGLESFGDFYDYPGGTKIGKNERRETSIGWSLAKVPMQRCFT